MSDIPLVLPDFRVVVVVVHPFGSTDSFLSLLTISSSSELSSTEIEEHEEEEEEDDDDDDDEEEDTGKDDNNDSVCGKFSLSVEWLYLRMAWSYARAAALAVSKVPR